MCALLKNNPLLRLKLIHIFVTELLKNGLEKWTRLVTELIKTDWNGLDFYIADYIQKTCDISMYTLTCY